MNREATYWRYGRATPVIEPISLRAGNVTAVLDGIDLRRVRAGGVEIAQRVYVAVRDSVWNTIPSTFSDLALDVHDDHFTVRFVARHDYEDLHFVWNGSIVGSPDGTIVYTMDGVAENAFQHNKIGFNVHHPLRESIGRRYRARTPDGPISGTLTAEIEPQRLVNGRLTAMFAPYSELAIEMNNGGEARFEFEGDLFEMQDHRNWTDGNFKSYGTPLSVPFPMRAEAGQRIHQAVTIRVAGPVAAPPEPVEQVRLDIGQATGYKLPPLGTCMASHGASLSTHEADMLRRLGLDHLRVDLVLDDPTYRDKLDRGMAAADALNAGLELALHVPDDASEALQAVADQLVKRGHTVARILVFPRPRGATPAPTTPDALMRAVRDHLREVVPGVPFVGGTDQFFAELNRDRPDVRSVDGVVYSINPQVHASDDTSLVENLSPQADTVAMARTFCGDKPIVISPVTLIGRNGPWAAGPPRSGGLPPQVDVRQASLFGAGWTAGSVKYLAESGGASITYYETTGWLGLMERADGAPEPGLFPSTPGAPFPLYHILGDLTEWRGGDVVRVVSEDPLAVEGLAIRRDGRMHLIVANLSPVPREIVVGPLSSPRAALRMLDEETAGMAETDPDGFRASGQVAEVRDGAVMLRLRPCAVARIDEAPL